MPLAEIAYGFAYCRRRACCRGRHGENAGQYGHQGLSALGGSDDDGIGVGDRGVSKIIRVIASINARSWSLSYAIVARSYVVWASVMTRHSSAA